MTGAGSAFVRFGHLFQDILNVNSLRGGAATTNVGANANLFTRLTSTILPDFANGTAIPQVVNGAPAALATFQAAMQTWPAQYQSYAQYALKAMYGIDLGMSSKLPLASFQALLLTDAMKTLIAQMVSAGAYVQPATVTAGAQTAVGVPTGNPQIVVSLKNGQGYLLQLPFPETLTFKVAADAQGPTPATVAGNETVTVYGQTGITDSLNQAYPGGSGIAVALSAVDGSKYLGTTGNVMNNSDFVTYTNANIPDNWIKLVGTIGTDILNGSGAQVYTTGGGSLEFLGDGATLSSVAQTFSATPSTALGSGGTSQGLLPDTVYHFNIWVLTPAVPAAGIVEFSLINSSNAIIADDQSTNNSATLNLNTNNSTAWTAVNGAFRTPSVLPSAIKFRIRLSTALSNTKTVFFGRLSFARANAANNGNGLYAGGPFCTIHSGNVNMINGLVPDQWTIAIANNYATSGTGLMQLMMDRIFGLRSLATPALQMPYAGSGTAILDSLIA